MTQPAAPAGWYADPSGRFEYRYWDGSKWSEHVSRAGSQSVDPPNAPPPPDEAVTPQEAPPAPAATAPAWGSAATVPASPPGWSQAPQPSGETEPFSIVSLVAGLAGLVAVGIGSVVAIVFGHIARSRIKRSGKHGKGFALTGLILGYLEIVGAIVGIVVLVVVVVGAFNDARDTARVLGRQIYVEAGRQSSSPRDASVVHRAIRDLGLRGDRVLVGSTSEHASEATTADLASEGWHLEVHRGTLGQACLRIPASVTDVTEISTGSC